MKKEKKKGRKTERSNKGTNRKYKFVSAWTEYLC
jgi:hypothetical protein